MLTPVNADEAYRYLSRLRWVRRLKINLKGPSMVVSGTA